VRRAIGPMFAYANSIGEPLEEIQRDIRHKLFHSPWYKNSVSS
jgi:hypothetical protein